MPNDTSNEDDTIGKVASSPLPGASTLSRKPGSPTKTAGSDGVYSYGGRLVSFERQPELQGRNMFTTFDNIIANAVIVGASVRYFQSLIGGTAWSVAPREDAGADGKKAAKIVEEGLFNANMTLPWSNIVKKAVLFKYYGFSMHEWCVRRRKDGMVVFKDIEHRPQHTIDMWDIPEGGGPFRGVVQLVPTRPEFFYVPRERLLYCVDNTLTDAPNGVGLLRHVVEHARRLSRYEQLEGFGYEGDLRGMAVAKVPGSELAKIADTENKKEGWVDEQTSAMHQFVRNHIKTPFQGIVLDSATYTTDILGSATPTVSAVPKWAVDIIKGTSTGLAEINVVIERLNREIARVLGMEFLLLGGDGKGSLALSRDKTSMFAAVLESTLSELSWFTLHDLVWPLLELNGLDPEVCAPQVNPDPIATERIEAVIAALVGLAQAGAVLQPDDPAINQVRSRLHLADQPKLSPELLSARAQAVRGVPPGTQPGKPGGKPGEPGGGAKPGSPSISAEQRAGAAVADGENGGNKTERQLAKEAHARTLFRVNDDEE
jgi:hypothetical protein